MKLSTRLACHLSNIDIGVSDSTCIQSIVHFRLCWPLLSQPSLGNNYNYQTIAEFAIVTGQQSKFGCSSSFSSKLFPHPFSPEVQLMSSCCYPAYSVPSWLNSRDVTPSKATLLAIKTNMAPLPKACSIYPSVHSACKLQLDTNKLQTQKTTNGLTATWSNSHFR